MAVGIYGNIRPSDVSPSDVEIYYTYTPDRTTEITETKSLVSEDILVEEQLPLDEQFSGEENILEGFYTVNLPATIFNEIGIYTLYFRPKVLKDVNVSSNHIKIVDCGVLSALPTVKGIVIDGNQLEGDLTANNALQGYKIEYIDSEGNKIRNLVRHVVTSNKVIPVTENIGTTSQSAVRYRFDDSGNLIFLQVTPSSSSNVKPNVSPFIGVPDQSILMSNTYFNPLAMEVEFVETDIQTLANYVAGEQIKDVDNGILSYYDEDRNITKQFDLYEIKDDVTNTSLYEVKQQRTNIDPTQNFNEIIEDVDQ